MLIVIICFAAHLLHTISSNIIRERQDNYLLKELNSTNDTKLWVQHLHVPLTEILEVAGEHGFHVIYKSFRWKTYRMINWCFPDVRETITGDGDIHHIEPWLPCGYAKMIQGMQPDEHVFRFSTASYLNIQIRFIRFEMDYTQNCSYSSWVKICIPNITASNWQCPKLYCGHRKPWVMTIDYHHAALLLKQVNVQVACNLTFIYSSIGIEISKVYRKHHAVSVVHHLGYNHSSISLVHHHSYVRHPRKWLLVAKKGDQFNFIRIKTCCYSAVVEIFDGSQDYHLLHKSGRIYNSDRKLNVTSVYFSSTVHYYPDEYDHNLVAEQLFKLRFVSNSLREKYLQLNQMKRVNNNGGLLQVSLGINLTSGGFPNISFVIRRFGDWNEELCSFGGYILRHHINTTMFKATLDQGPFCPGSGPSTPFVGTLGPKHIVLGGFQYVLIIFAFGPWYDIDIDVTMSLSECEGLFEPLSMCSVVIPEQNIFQMTRYIKARHYRLYCSAANYKDSYFHTVMSVSISNISKCIIFQTISLHRGVMEKYGFQSEVNVNIDVNIGSAYLMPYPSYADIFSKLLIGTMNNGTTYVPIKKNYHAKHITAATVLFDQLNYQQTHRVFMWMNLFPVAKINKVRLCSSINSSSRFTQRESKTVFAKTLIHNLCGIFYYQKQETYLLEFYVVSSSFARDDVKQTESFLYTKFETLCSNELRNILTVLGGVSHSVSVLHKHLQVNHQYLPVHFIVINKMGCSFSMEYRLRQFYTNVAFGILPQHSILRVSKADNTTCIVFIIVRSLLFITTM